MNMLGLDEDRLKTKINIIDGALDWLKNILKSKENKKRKLEVMLEASLDLKKHDKLNYDEQWVSNYNSLETNSSNLKGYWFVKEINERNVFISTKPGIKIKCKCQEEHPLIFFYTYDVNWFKSWDIPFFFYICPKNESINYVNGDLEEVN